MPVNGMNTGTDYSLQYYDSTSGTIVDLGDVQDVNITAGHHLIKNQRYNAVPLFGYVPDGFKIDFSIVRNGNDIEAFMVTLAQNFNAGSVQKPGYLMASVTNPDGSITKYQYTNMVLFLTDHGNISRDKPTTLKLEGYASDKIPLN
jgi:hypothetical protein